MKRVGVILNDDLHKQLKLYAVHQGKTVTEIVTELITKEVETKKEQTH